MCDKVGLQPKNYIWPARATLKGENSRDIFIMRTLEETTELGEKMSDKTPYIPSYMTRAGEYDPGPIMAITLIYIILCFWTSFLKYVLTGTGIGWFNWEWPTQVALINYALLASIATYHTIQDRKILLESKRQMEARK